MYGGRVQAHVAPGIARADGDRHVQVDSPSRPRCEHSQDLKMSGPIVVTVLCDEVHYIGALYSFLSDRRCGNANPIWTDLNRTFDSM